MGKHKRRKSTSEIEIDGIEMLGNGVVKNTKTEKKQRIGFGRNVVKNNKTVVMEKRCTDVTPRFLTKIQREESANKLKEAKKIAKRVANEEKRRDKLAGSEVKRVETRAGKRWHELNASFPWLKFALVALVLILPWHEATMMREARDIEGAQYGEVALVTPPKAAVSVQERDLTGKKLVALTFDDGPSAGTTGRLLDILREKQVKATFFVVGTMAQQAPELVKREEQEGHEVASHTLAHNNLARMSSDAIKGEQAAFEGAMNEILGRRMELMRPPYGSVNDTVRSTVEQPMIMWSVDPQDWKDRNAGTVRSRVRAATYDGAIVLMHDIHASTVDAVAGIIDDLRADGYEFLTVSELAEVRGVKMENGVTYGSFRP